MLCISPLARHLLLLLHRPLTLRQARSLSGVPGKLGGAKPQAVRVLDEAEQQELAQMMRDMTDSNKKEHPRVRDNAKLVLGLQSKHGCEAAASQGAHRCLRSCHTACAAGLWLTVLLPLGLPRVCSYLPCCLRVLPCCCQVCCARATRAGAAAAAPAAPHLRDRRRRGGSSRAAAAAAAALAGQRGRCCWQRRQQPASARRRAWRPDSQR